MPKSPDLLLTLRTAAARYRIDNSYILRPNKTIIGSYDHNNPLYVYFRTGLITQTTVSSRHYHQTSISPTIKSLTTITSGNFHTAKIWIDHCSFEGLNLLTVHLQVSPRLGQILNFKGSATTALLRRSFGKLTIWCALGISNRH